MSKTEIIRKQSPIINKSKENYPKSFKQYNDQRFRKNNFLFCCLFKFTKCSLRPSPLLPDKHSKWFNKAQHIIPVI
jgi:hypothetical protein